ncbi:MAG: serine hydrolase [Chitinophagaceae bacterium]|nr:serine hydrolase [Chitinophagaceae bacterium]
MVRSLIIISFFVILNSSFAQSRIDKNLQKQIQSLIQGFRGDIGVYVKDLKRNKIAAINVDTVFPTASMVKIPILIGVMDKIEKGELQYHQELIYKDSLLYEGVDILGSFKNDEKTELSKIMMLMLTMSDNTASLWLQSLAGTGTRINRILDSIGFNDTRVNSRTPGREDYRSIYGWGQTTPREMAELVEKIYLRKIVSEKASDQMMRLLGRNYWDDQAISAIPPTIQLFSKNGAVNASRSEVVLVNAPRTPYIFCVCTKNNKDESWAQDNEAWVLVRKISSLLWKHFN